MKKMVSLSLIFLLFSNSFIQAKNIYNLYYLEDTQEEKMIYGTYKFLGDFSDEEKLYYLVKKFFESDKNLVKGIFIEKDDLYINFNDEILNLLKGSSAEISFLRTFLHTIFQFEQIQTVTFLNKGKIFVISNSGYIEKYKREDLQLINKNFD